MTKHSLFANQRLSEDTAFQPDAFPYKPPPENKGALSAKEIVKSRMQSQRKDAPSAVVDSAVEEQKDDASDFNHGNAVHPQHSESTSPDQVGDEYGFRAQMEELAKAIFGNCGTFISDATYNCMRPSNSQPPPQQQQPQHSPYPPQANSPRHPPPQHPHLHPPQAPLPPQYYEPEPVLPYGPAPIHPPMVQPHYHYPPEPPPLSIADELRQLAAKAGMPMMAPPRGNVPKFLGEDAIDSFEDDNISAISQHTLEEMARRNKNSDARMPGLLHPLCQPQHRLSKTSASASSGHASSSEDLEEDPPSPTRTGSSSSGGVPRRRDVV
mmetsp:Transcript_18895/g.39147  ORF Transcript_18895/g.39147 Transcript_18895/m.39147 type:complete len:324 (-) Transcript_18895:271-1242(-)|eukprot:CAMPEP_0172455042 /NCGR_PEP_ID=MMETSP1065-20121228/11849_1 /TAXON_ID=265537 /ORGANISM="Amphiprora paludosa, Strain CCMP125" /LENGTH=323 /DNA_ID=CAMNT_0013207481 /DNA_START=250 /DNA_END=1221 /DNA_ORIENTATION=+